MKILLFSNISSEAEIIYSCLLKAFETAEVILASTASGGVALLKSLEPDLVIADTELPDMDGFALCSQIRQFSNVPLIIISNLSKTLDIERGLELGADDYIVKPPKLIELQARVRSLLRRSKKTTSTASGRLIIGKMLIDFDSNTVTVEDRPVQLTYTEYLILCCLAESVGKLVRHEVILGKVWGTSAIREKSLLRAHIQHLREKLVDKGKSSGLIVSVRGRGYMLIKDASI